MNALQFLSKWFERLRSPVLDGDAEAALEFQADVYKLEAYDKRSEEHRALEAKVRDREANGPGR